ncbi:unnamed protein product [Euphydryas editha]|uniref:Uncharacterized protein n=1 Tax=Euphydryas editha TaxID=104508 RepID=A0AAU9VCJ0_EUPED|nr:unnamed protein product [Euphydryas editha]
MAQRNVFSERQSEILAKTQSARLLAHRHRPPPLPRPLPRESENLLGTFSPPGPSRVGRIAPPLAAPPRPLTCAARSAPRAGGWRGGGAATRCALEISLSFTDGY